MADILSNLLSQLENDTTKYYLVKNKQLYTEDTIEVYRNDKNSTNIEIILPQFLGGQELNDSFTYYIDYLDGKGKQGFISNKETLKIVKVIDSTGETVQKNIYSTFIRVENGALIAIDNNTKIINNNHFINNKNDYYVLYNDINKNNPNYLSSVKNENLEDSTLISSDFPSGYADGAYYNKNGGALKFGTDTKEITVDEKTQIVKYCHLDWSLDNNVTENVGEVIFSIRIEKDSFVYQTNTNSFLVKENLKEYYSLRKEIEENYIIQNREIKPVGDFSAVLVKGDNNSNKLFYKMNRYFQGQDMLAPKIIEFNSNTYNIVKDKNNQSLNIYYAQKDDKYYKTETEYKINNIIINFNDNDNLQTYIWEDGQKVTINNAIFSDFTLIRKSDKTFQLSYKINNGNITIKNLGTSLLNNTVELNTGLMVELIFNAYADKIIVTSETIDDLIAVPVFNRIIRFVFTSPNKDYADYNLGEIEYINNEENYFIFSWTPNYQVTKTAGEVSYSIEFYINSLNNLIDLNGNTIQSKSYSWSTLPSTIKVEENEAVTASSDYIPNWVSYIENYFQNDFNQFLKVDLQSQFSTFKNELTNNLGVNLEEIIGTNSGSNNIYNFSLPQDLELTATITKTTDDSYNFKQIYEDGTGGEVKPLEKLSTNNNNFIYVARDYKLKIQDNYYYSCIYYNSILDNCIIYYSVDLDNKEILIPKLENKINSAITNFYKQIYNNPAESRFNTNKTLEQDFIDLLNNNKSENQKELNKSVQELGELIDLLNTSYTIDSERFIIHSNTNNQDYGLNVQVGDNNQNLVTLDKSQTFIWKLISSLEDYKPCIELQYYYSTSTAFYDGVNEGSVYLSDGAEKIITKTNNKFYIDNILILESITDVKTITIDNINYQVSYSNNRIIFIISQIKKYILPINSYSNRSSAGEVDISGNKYNCYLYSIIDDLNEQVIERTNNVSNDVKDIINNYLIKENVDGITLSEVNKNSLIGQLVENINNTLSPYTQGSNGEVYQTIFSNIIASTNTDDIENMFQSYLTAIKAEATSVTHNFTDGTLTITV